MTAASQPNTQEPLTPKEQEVMEYYSNPFLEKREIASRLFITVGTLNNHILSAFSKLGETDRFAASLKFWWLYPDCRDRVAGEIDKAFNEAA